MQQEEYVRLLQHSTAVKCRNTTILLLLLAQSRGYFLTQKEKKHNQVFAYGNCLFLTMWRVSALALSINHEQWTERKCQQQAVKLEHHCSITVESHPCNAVFKKRFCYGAQEHKHECAHSWTVP